MKPTINPFVFTLFMIAPVTLILGIWLVGDASTRYYDATADAKMTAGVALLAVGIWSLSAGFVVAAIGWYLREQTAMQVAPQTKSSRE